MYRLLLKKRDSEVWQRADFGTDTPAMTFATHDISNFETRQSNYSQRLKLPLTAKNKRIFDFVNDTHYNGNIYKEYLDARLHYNGAELLGVGGILTIVGVKEDGIEVCLLSSVKDFYTQLEAIDFENTDVLGTPKLPTKSFTEGESQVTDNTDFVFVQYNNGNGMNYEQKNGFIQFGLPMLRVCHNNESGLLPRLCKTFGYELITNYDLNNQCLSLIDRKTNKGIEECYRQGLDAQNYTGVSEGISEKSLSIKESILNANRYILFVINAFVGDNGNLSIGFDIRRDKDDITSYANYGIFNSFSGGFEQNEWQQSPSDSNRYIKQMIFDVVTNKIYYSDENGNFYLHGTPQTIKPLDFSNFGLRMKFKATTSLQGTLKLNSYILSTSQGDGIALSGCTLNVAKSLGWKNGRDAMMNLCKIYGSITQVDNFNKKFYFNSLAKIQSNKSKAKDWSDKLLKGVEQTFIIGQFAQANTIVLEQNTQDNNIQSKASFTIANKTLSDQKDILNVPLESPRKQRYIYQVNGDEFVPNKAPTLAKIAKDSSGGYYFIDSTQNANNIIAYYKDYADMLNKGFIIDVKLNLTANDVADIDFFVPIYLKQYGRYFYINEIKNFIANTPTEATLIAI